MKAATFLKTSSIALFILFTSTQVNAATASRKTEHFISNAAIANQFEIESSDLALQRSHSRSVRRFAREMIDEHTQANRRMKWVLREEGLRNYMPRDLDRRRQKILNNLRADSSDNFDRDYIDIGKDTHDWEVSFYRDYSRNGDNARLRDFASRMLPTLRDHERMASDLEKDLRHGRGFSLRDGRFGNEIEPSAGDAKRDTDDRHYQDRSNHTYGPYRRDRPQ